MTHRKHAAALLTAVLLNVLFKMIFYNIKNLINSCI